MYRIYLENKHSWCLQREKDSAWIPRDRNNVDYQEYLRWFMVKENRDQIVEQLKALGEANEEKQDRQSATVDTGNTVILDTESDSTKESK